MNKSTFGFDKPEDSPGFLLWQTTILWQRAIKKTLAPYDISHAQFVILAVMLWLDETKQSSIQSTIVEKTKLDKMTVSQSIKKLVSQGLIQRQEHSKDTRAKSVSLTTKGKKYIKKLVSAIEKTDAIFFDNIEKSNNALLLKLLNDIVSINSKDA